MWYIFCVYISSINNSHVIFPTYPFFFQRELIQDEDFIKEALDRQEIDSEDADLSLFID